MEKLGERVSSRRREITHSKTGETGLRIEMEWFHAEGNYLQDVLSQVRPRLSVFRAAGKG